MSLIHTSRQRPPARHLPQPARILLALRGLQRLRGLGVVYEQCDPHDTACVMRNQALNDQTLVAIQAGQAQNNYDQCLSNAANASSPEQYADTIARCNGQYSTQAPPSYTPQAWSPVEYNQPVNLVYGPAPVSPNTSAPAPTYTSTAAPAPAPIAPVYVAPAPVQPTPRTTITTTPPRPPAAAPPPAPAPTPFSDPYVVSTPLTDLGHSLNLPASIQPVLAAADAWPWYYWIGGAALAYLLGRKQHA
jgi:hypothetical protein